MSAPEPTLGDVLATDRTVMAAERTLMAWVRTALSMISFGFGIYKFIQVLQEESTATFLRSKRLLPGRAHPRWDLALVVACVIALLGLLLFGSIALNAGPFG